MTSAGATRRDLYQKVSIMEGTIHALIERLHQHEQALTIILSDRQAHNGGSPLQMIPPRRTDAPGGMSIVGAMNDTINLAERPDGDD